MTETTIITQVYDCNNICHLLHAYAHLGGLDLTEKQLQGAQLPFAHLESTILVNTNLSNANLSNANLFRANLDGANLTEANLSLVYARGVRFPIKLTNSNFYMANLIGTEFSNTHLYSVNFTKAVLIGANLSNADIRDAIFDEADLTGADLRGVNLKLAASLRNVRGLSTKTEEMNYAQAIVDILNIDGNELNMNDCRISKYSNSLLGWQSRLQNVNITVASNQIPTLAYYVAGKTTNQSAMVALQKVASGKESIWN